MHIQQAQMTHIEPLSEAMQSVEGMLICHSNKKHNTRVLINEYNEWNDVMIETLCLLY